MTEPRPSVIRAVGARVALAILAFLATFAATANAQTSDAWVLCDGPPPLGWVWCACELTSDGYEWICYDEWGTGIPGPPPSTPEDESRTKTELLPTGSPRQGLNSFSTRPYTPRGGPRRILVMRGWDRNHDGIIEEAERVPFADITVLGGRIRELAVHVANATDAKVYITAAGVGVVLAEDIDGDHLAMTPGETRVVLGANSSRTIAGSAGPVVMDHRGMRRIASARGARNEAVIVAWEQNDLCVYKLRDANLDGDFADSGERFNYFNGAGVQVGPAVVSVRPGWILNADVASGQLPSYYDSVRLQAEVDALAYTTQPPSPRNPTGEVLYFASTLTPRSGMGGRHGLIYRGIDRNGDHDVNDAGETTLYYNPSNAAGIPYPIRRVLDMVAEDNDLFVLQSNGPQNTSGASRPTIWRLRDLNFDGDAMDPGEASLELVLRKEFPIPTELERYPRTSRLPGPLIVPYGWSCTGSAGTPLQTALGVPQIGSPTPLGALVSNLPAGTAAALVIGTSRSSSGGLDLPLDLGPYGLPSCALLAAPDLVLPGIAGPRGNLRIGLGNIPPLPSLSGLHLFTQCLAIETNPSTTGRAALLSHGIWWRFSL